MPSAFSLSVYIYINLPSTLDCGDKEPRAACRLSRAAAAALYEIISHLHLEHGVDASESVYHGGDERTVTTAN
jgi:hypothetical protein